MKREPPIEYETVWHGSKWREAPQPVVATQGPTAETPDEQTHDTLVLEALPATLALLERRTGLTTEEVDASMHRLRAAKLITRGADSSPAMYYRREELRKARERKKWREFIEARRRRNAA